MNLRSTSRHRIQLQSVQITLTLILLLLCGCNSLTPIVTPAPAFFSLDNPIKALSADERAADLAPIENAPTLLVNAPSAESGFDSQHIIYIRELHRLEYFSQSEWIDTPARMLQPLIVDVLSRSGAFRAVVSASSLAVGELRLSTQIIKLQHEFTTQPGQFRFTLRAYLIDSATSQIVAFHEFDEVVVPPTDSTYDGIVAANQAVQNALQELSYFCLEASRNWHKAY